MTVVVVGGGTAGCVLAARLSEDARCGVVLLEAGPDYPSAADLPADVADGAAPTVSHDWGYTSVGGVALPRARLVGGCSATNAAFWLRGWPADYDGWAAAGNPGWGFADLLPTLRAIEADADHDGPCHGTAGPVPVRRRPDGTLPALHRAFLDAARAAGHPGVADHNTPGAVGAGAIPRNVRDGVRMSTALTHLAAARDRPNLTVRAGVTVDRVDLAGTRVRGVRLATGELVAADRVVLAAGAYGSPAVLLRSGVGPGLAVDLPGVGANLTDHPLVAVDLPTAPGPDGPGFHVLVTLHSSRADPAGPPDLHLFSVGPFDHPDSPAGAVFGIVTGLLSVRSRGSVRLRSADPADPPLIDPAHLRHADDLARMVEATVHARRIARTAPLRDFVHGPELAPGEAIDDTDEDALAESVLRRVGSYHHPVGTCAMGPDPARGAVVDARGRVHGVEGLWVADASVMPAIPSANPNLTVVAIAERIAGWLAGKEIAGG